MLFRIIGRGVCGIDVRREGWAGCCGVVGGWGCFFSGGGFFGRLKLKPNFPHWKLAYIDIREKERNLLPFGYNATTKHILRTYAQHTATPSESH